MASPAVTRPPATLPANFDGWDKTPPQTLPADFSGWDKPAAAHTTKPPQGFFSSAADSSGLSGIAHAIAHPYDTITAIPGAIVGAAKNAVTEAHDEVNALRDNGLTQETRRKLGGDIPIIGPTLAKAQAQHDSGNNAGMAGTLAGTVASLAAPSIAKAARPIFGTALEATGSGLQDAGAGVLNKTGGMLKADFKRGANGGRAYLDAGGGPAMSMQGLADKAAALKSGVGSQIGGVRNAATASGLKIPTQDIAGALSPGISKGIALETGPGGLGNTGSIENYSASFRPTLRAGITNGGLTPNELQALKSGIADNTNWSDPSQFNLKAIRQQGVGALSGLENAAIPEIGPLKGQFQGLSKFAARTADRASTGSSPLTTLAGKLGGAGLGAALGAGHGAPAMLAGTGLGLTLDSIPVKTALATGLYRGGKGLVAIGTKIK